MGRRRIYKSKPLGPVGCLDEPRWGRQSFGNMSGFGRVVIFTDEHMGGPLYESEWYGRDFNRKDGSVPITGAERGECSPKALEVGRFNIHLSFAKGGERPQHEFDYIEADEIVDVFPADILRVLFM
ncbi:MAG: hypothetical protein KJ718_04885 [Nanoarchaeota archaeon]|nr:hypothetical protein [Nanoarchaeota archaeon]MBU1051861.1 hypothetical protein [Nanoarchaeota archaeon]MBU1987973.1 hypothetical protein [Nanoarchaeota archaeon]